MSLVFNMVGGGGGKLKDTDAVLVVTVPTGSTVTATKGGTTLTPTMWVKAADNTLDCAIFSIPASQFDSTTPWTITATDGTNTASDTVLITTNKEYEVTLSFVLFIYNVGDQCSSTTGGWGGNGTYTLATSYIDVPLAYGGAYANVRTSTKIDLTDYQTLYFEWDGSIRVGTGGTNLTMWVASNQISSSGVGTPSGATIQNQVGGNTQGTYVLGERQLDVSNLSGEYYIGFHGGRGGGSGDDWTKAHLLKAYLKE